MIKLPFFILFIVMGIVVGVQILFIYGDINTYDATIEMVCGKDNDLCHKMNEARVKKCYAPFMTISSRSACFTAATDEVNKTSFPNVQSEKMPTNAQNADMLAWVARMAPDVFTFNAQNYDAHMKDASRYFTKKGWDSFIKALIQSQLAEAVKARNLKVHLTLDSTPTLISSGIRNDVQSWDIKCLVTIRYQTQDTREDSLLPTNAQLLLRIMRVSNKDNPDGIGIEQWLLLTNDMKPALAH